MSQIELETITNVWERHDDEAYRRDQSHWRGHGRWADDAAWQEIGQSSVQRLKAFARYLDRPFPSAATVLEWGPGGGTNLFALRHVAQRYIGIDIASSNLAEAKRMIEAEADTQVNFEPVLLEDEPQSLVDRIDGGVDMFLSTAVFQHFPSNDYGRRVLETIRQLCKPDALGFIHIRFDNDNPKFHPISSLSEYRERHIQANSYRLDAFKDLLEACNFRFHYYANIRTQNNSAVAYITVK